MGSSLNACAPRTAPLYHKLEEVCGPIPEPREGFLWLPLSLLHQLPKKMGYEAKTALAVLIGMWLNGDTVLEAWASRKHDKAHSRAVRRLAKQGLISLDTALDLATLNEEAVLSLLNTIDGKGEQS